MRKLFYNLRVIRKAFLHTFNEMKAKNNLKTNTFIIKCK